MARIGSNRNRNQGRNEKPDRELERRIARGGGVEELKRARRKGKGPQASRKVSAPATSEVSKPSKKRRFWSPPALPAKEQARLLREREDRIQNVNLFTHRQALIDAGTVFPVERKTLTPLRSK